jgi:glutathione synthase/RimK-type ligase-like ATP-grasp enzyme
VPVLLATCADFPTGDEDAELLEAALRRAGVEARWAVWDDPTVDWAEGLTVLRSTWDYTADRDRFLAWVRRLPRVLNPPEVVEWSTDKTYLADLASAGVPTVETVVLPPGEPLGDVTGEFVVKPAVGAGSRGVGRFGADGADAARAHVGALHAAGRTALVQPYLAEVDRSGEAALIYLDGRFSHAITKGAMIGAGMTHPVQGDALYVEENISPREASAHERAVADAALRYVDGRFGADLLYARVDLLPSDDGPVVVELELVEPSLFLGHAAGGAAADRFAAAIGGRT